MRFAIDVDSLNISYDILLGALLCQKGAIYLRLMPAHECLGIRCMVDTMVGMSGSGRGNLSTALSSISAVLRLRGFWLRTLIGV